MAKRDCTVNYAMYVRVRGMATSYKETITCVDVVEKPGTGRVPGVFVGTVGTSPRAWRGGGTDKIDKNRSVHDVNI